jgi:hypothetical protein
MQNSVHGMRHIIPGGRMHLSEGRQNEYAISRAIMKAAAKLWDCWLTVIEHRHCLVDLHKL